VYGYMDIISWTYWIYLKMDLPLVDVVNVLVWCIMSWGGYWVMWHVVLLCWPRSIVGWVHWPSAHRSISPVAVELVSKMTPNSSFSFPYFMFLVNAWFVSDFHIHVCCWECVMHMLIQGYLFWYILLCSWCCISIDLPVWPTWFVTCFAL